MKFLLITLALIGVSCASAVQDEFVRLDEATKSRLDFSRGVLQSGEVLPTDANAPQLRTAAINNKLIAMLESARDSFATGSGSMPPLDPFKHDHIGPVNFEYSIIIRGTLNLNNLDIRGLREFIINNLEFRIIGLTLDFGFIVPEIIYNSHYNIDSRVGIARWRPSGNARISLHEAWVGGSATLGTQNGHLLLRAFRVEFDVARSDLDIENLLGNGMINIMLNWVLNRVSDSFIQEQKDRASSWASEQLFHTIDGVLRGFTLADLLS